MKVIKLILITCILGILNADYPEYNFNIQGEPYPSQLFVHTMSSINPHIGILNADLSMYWNVNNGDHGFDFRKNNEHLSYYNKIDKHWIIVDQSMVEVDTVRCANDFLTDYHDIRALDNGNYLLQCYDSTWVISDQGSPQLIRDILIIQEIDDSDSLIFQWNALDHLSINDYPDINLSMPEVTFMHGNSIEVDTDNNLLISNRTSNEIIKLDRESGEIIWILGGPLNEFAFINDPLNGFNKQHDVRRITNGNITLFDNGTQHNPMLSRAVEYELNETNKTATLIWEYVHPDSIVAMAMGSVQRLSNGNTLINWGFFFETNILNAGSYITEVDYDKNLIFQLEYPLGYHIYRARKNDWEFSINTVPGDTNLDTYINVIDIIYLVNYILDSNDENRDHHTLFNRHKIDLNTDGEIDILDITNLVASIIN